MGFPPQIIGEVGTVQVVQASGDLRVRFSSGKVWTMNSDSATKVGTRNNHMM